MVSVTSRSGNEDRHCFVGEKKEDPTILLALTGRSRATSLTPNNGAVVACVKVSEEGRREVNTSRSTSRSTSYSITLREREKYADR